jgi:hypothetical protein
MPVSNELALVDRAYAHVLQRQLVTSVGVAPGLLRELTNDDVECLLTYSGTLEDMSKWTLADLMVWGEIQAANRVGVASGKVFWEVRDAIWDELLAACKADISKHTAYNMVSTAKAFPWERRRHTKTLSFEHHRIVASRDNEQQEYWLDLAEAGEWSVAKLRHNYYSNADPMTSTITVMSTPKDLWPEYRVEKEVYEAFSLPTRYDTVQRIVRLVQQVKEEIVNEQANRRPGTRTG